MSEVTKSSPCPFCGGKVVLGPARGEWRLAHGLSVPIPPSIHIEQCVSCGDYGLDEKQTKEVEQACKASLFPSYISITDFTSSSQVYQMLEVLKEIPTPSRKLGVGVMTSYKTLNGLPTKWSAVFPAPDKIAEIFIEHEHVVNVLHYADYEGIDVWSNLIRAAGLGGPNLHCLQLDMVWPDPEALLVFRFCYPDIRLILQVGRAAMDVLGNDPIRVATKLEEYKLYVDAVLLDRSGGEGRLMESSVILPYARAITSSWPFNLVVAGGLGPDTLSPLDDILSEFPGVSIDAQGRLRPSHSALDPVDWEMAGNYVRRAAQKLSKEHP